MSKSLRQKQNAEKKTSKVHHKHCPRASNNGLTNLDKYLQDLSSSSDDIPTKKMETKKKRPKLFNHDVPFSPTHRSNIRDCSKLSRIPRTTDQAVELEKHQRINWNKYLEDLSSSADDETSTKKMETNRKRLRLFSRYSGLLCSTPFNPACTSNIGECSKLSPIMRRSKHAAELEMSDEHGPSRINSKGKDHAEDSNKHIAVPRKKCKHLLCRKELFCKKDVCTAATPVRLSPKESGFNM